MIKRFPWFLIVVPLVIIIYMKHDLITDPEKALFVALSSSSYNNWEVEYLLDNSNVPRDDNFMTLQAIVINGHDELLERYIAKIPKDKRVRAYKPFKNMVIPQAMDNRLRLALGFSIETPD